MARSMRLIFVWLFPAFTALFWVAMFVGTHLPPRNLPPVPMLDKVQHFLSFYLLSILLYACLWARGARPRTAAVLVLGIVLTYGVLDEQTQPLVGRSCSVADWLADAAGAIVAVALMGSLHAVRSRRPAAQEPVALPD